MSLVSGDGTLVVVPTFNEVASVPRLIAGLRDHVPAAAIVVVDDSSPDGTGDVVAEIADKDEAVSLLSREHRDGLGSAYVAGFAWGLRRGFDVLAQMDADGSHLADQLPRLLSALSWADVAIGSRYVAGGSVVNWPPHRELLSRGGNRYIRLLTGLPVRDATAGFRAYRATGLQRLPWQHVSSQGYSFQIEMTRDAVAAGLEIAEVPITFVERTTGASKMSLGIVAEAGLRTAVWGVADRLAPFRRT